MLYRDAIRIVGAGPAGLTAAILLAKAGRNVEVFDHRNDVGGRFNEDFQGLENWTNAKDVLTEISEMGILLNFWRQPITGGTIYNPMLMPLKVSSKTPLVYLIKRGIGVGTLDTSLKEQAKAVGVKLNFGVHRNNSDDNIIASGPRTIKAIAAGITFDTNLPTSAYAIANNSLAPKGYAYLLIAGGKATLATVLFSQFTSVAEYLNKSIKTLTELVGINRIEGMKRWSGYGDFSIPSTAIHDGRIYIGEAAGFQDGLFGFGIRHAMVSAYLAAKSILEEIDYDHLWKQRLFPILKASSLNRLLYNRMGSLAYYLLWLAIGKTRKPERFMQWLYSWTTLKQVTYPIIEKVLR